MKMRLSSPLALAVVMVAALSTSATVRAETITSRSSGNSLFVYADTYDSATGAYTFIFASAGTGKFHTSGGGPDTTGGGFLYYSTSNPTTGENCYGFGDATAVSIGDKLSSGSASFTVPIDCFLYDPVTGTNTYTGSDVITVAVDLVGTGTGIGKQRYTSTYKDPSHFNSTYTFTGSFREASVAISVDGEPLVYDPSSSFVVADLANGRVNSKVTINP